MLLVLVCLLLFRWLAARPTQTLVPPVPVVGRLGVQSAGLWTINWPVLKGGRAMESRFIFECIVQTPMLIRGIYKPSTNLLESPKVLC